MLFLAGGLSYTALPHSRSCLVKSPLQPHQLVQPVERRRPFTCWAAKKRGSTKTSGGKKKSGGQKTQAPPQPPPVVPDTSPADNAIASSQPVAQGAEVQPKAELEDKDGGQPAEAHAPSTPPADSQLESDAASTAGRAQQGQIRQAEQESVSPSQLFKQQQEFGKKPSLVEGVLAEVGLIEWPTIPNALLNTALVIAIVGASSVMLFGVNSLLAEGSKALYKSAGKASAEVVQESPKVAQPVRGTAGEVEKAPLASDTSQ